MNSNGEFGLTRPAGKRLDYRATNGSELSSDRKKIKIYSQFTEGFGEFLLRHRVGIVYSTYQSGQLIFIGARPDGKPVPSAAGFTRAMGIAASSQRVYVGTKNEIWRLENILGVNETESETFDRLYVPRNAQVTGEMDIHELRVEPTGRIVFANTRFSCLSTVSTTHSFKPIWKPRFITKIAPEDRCHLNGLAMEGGKVRYVTVCSTSDCVQGWRENRREGGALIDVDSDDMIEGLSMPHSPRVLGSFVYLLESGRGALVRIDRQTGKREDVAFCPGFARGLAFVANFAVVTISLPRIVAFEGLSIAETMRSKGAVPWRGLMIIDLRNGDVVEWLRLDGDISELFDVAIIPGSVCPRGLGTDLLHMSEIVKAEPTSA